MFANVPACASAQPINGTDEPEPGVSGRRGARRLDWIEQPLAPVRDGLDPQTQDRLLGGLSLCMGIEAVIVLRNICGYSAGEAIEISAWAVQAILQSGLHALRLERTKLDDGGTR